MTRVEKIKQKEQLLDGIIRQEEDDNSNKNGAYDLVDAVNILIKYNPEWQEKITEFKKWNEKKEPLE